MIIGKKIYDKITKIIKLSAIWVIRILFAPNNFNVSVLKKIYYAINGGYISDQIVLYDLNKNNKHEYLSEFDWYKSRYINEPYNFILNDKLVCSDLLKQYIKVPENIIIKKNGISYFQKKDVKTYLDFFDYLKKGNEVYIKPINIGKGLGVNKIFMNDEKLYLDYKEISKTELMCFFDSRDNWFISSSISQSKELDKIYDKTTNTIRLITVRNPESNKCEVLYAVQRIGTKETIPVDNGSRGGLVAKIDLNNGTLSSAKSIKNKLIYDNHPDSGNPIKGFKIKNFSKIKKEFIDLMEKFPYLYFVAWDIIITDNGPVVIEANTSSGVNIIQVFGGQKNKELGSFYKIHKIIK